MSEEKFQMIAKTFHGLEKILATELEELGGDDIRIRRRAVSFRGDKKLMYKANFHCRTALKILKPIYEFQAKNEVELYDGIFHFKWTDIMSVKDTLAIDTVVLSNFFKHSKYVAYKVKDAIVDQFKKETGKRPSVNTSDPTYRINIHITDDACTLSLDSSGESLHRRGYRVSQGPAPLNEVLAAGMILLSGWDARRAFLDPMCGSGTLIIEAALLAHRIPPGIFRERFGFESWYDFDEQLFQEVINEDYEEQEFEHLIMGSDISSDAIKTAMHNVKSASLTKKVDLKILPFNKLTRQAETGMIIMNPPYGERLQNANLINFYKSVGDHLKKEFQDHEVWVLSSNYEALKHLGLHPTKKLTLFNGPLECKFYRYNIYKGSKKIKFKK